MTREAHEVGYDRRSDGERPIGREAFLADLALATRARRWAGTPSENADGNGGGRAGYAPVLALTVALAFAALGLVMPVVMLVAEPQPISDLNAALGLYATQRQGAESALYLAAFGVIMPIAIVAVPRLANAIAAGPNGPALPALAGLLLATLAGVIVFVRLTGLLPRGGGMRSLLLASGVWSVAAAAVLARAAQPRPWRPLLSIGEFAAVHMGGRGRARARCARHRRPPRLREPGAGPPRRRRDPRRSRSRPQAGPIALPAARWGCSRMRSWSGCCCSPRST